jgi:hypothetical protein
MAAALWPWLVLFLAQSQTTQPVKTTLCEIIAHPETFDRKLVELHALVESGADDLPDGVTDDKCGAELKFTTLDDAHLDQLVKSKPFRKLVKDVKWNPMVEGTFIGWFHRASPEKKTEAGLALEAVSDVAVKHLPKPSRDH